MPNRLTLSTLILIFSAQLAFAGTFTVTSNADSGPGTLREAITMANANGTIVNDTIIFNIPDVSDPGRTITLQAALPSLSSKIVIDATTQPGSKFGLSDTKIKLAHSGTPDFSQGMIISDAEDIEIYGIYFTNFKFGDPNLSEIRCALFMPGNVKNIRIGAAGKGNVFYNNAIGIANRYTWGSNPGDRMIDVSLQGNFFGLNEDGISYQAGGIAFIIRSFRNFTIGGNNVKDGNYFVAAYSGIVGSLTSDSATNNGFVNVINNTFGADYSKTIPIPCGVLEIRGDNSGYNSVQSDAIVTISKNTFNNPPVGFSSDCNGMLAISNISGFITITGNEIGALSMFIACQTFGIAINSCENGIIGGPTSDEQNIIALNNSYGIALGNNSNMTIQRNSLYCNDQGIRAVSNKVTIPKVKIINENGTDHLSGTADPNCKIEVFQTPQCAGCNNGRIFMGETFSDNNGDWSFIGNYTSAVTATATTQSGVTGEFAKPEFNAVYLTDKQPVCNQNNGYIKGMQFISGTKYYWIKNFIDTIFNQLDLTNIGPGEYKFIVEQTKYCYVAYSISLYNNSPDINEQYVSIIQPSCGHLNGAIEDLSLTGDYDKIYWISATGDTVSHSVNLINAGEGKYKLIIWNTTYGCADSTGWYELINQSGPALHTDNIQITNATCNNSNGSIINITADNVNGSPFIQWLDSLNNPVGSSFDLLNVPAGKYKLKFKDQGGCDTIITPFYIVPSTGKIAIDTAGKTITPAGCTVNNGAIRNISITGADSFQWQNLTTGSSAGITSSINNLPAGNYQLTASNSFGCSITSPVIIVPQAAFINIAVTVSQVQDAFCDKNNGLASIQNFNTDSSFYSFRWTDSASNQVISHSPGIGDLGAGTYFLIATDTDGCEKQIFKAVIHALPKPVIDLSKLSIVPDQCSLTKGAITGIHATGLQGSASYIWTGQNNQTVANTIDLNNISKGEYQLTITDAGACAIQSEWFIVGNDDNAEPSPLYDDIIIPRNSAATLHIKNFETGTYILYSDPAGTQVIQQNNTGIFMTPAVSADKYFYVQHISGSCNSSIVPVKVTVVDESMFAIPSAFTPNHDGLNDLLRLKVIGYIEVENFKIYNRNGEEVFSSKMVNDGWDGRFRGDEQPTGVFVWMAKGKDINGKPITGKGTFVLIR